MGSFIEKFLGFKDKPRDASAPGIPLTQDDQVVLFWNNRTTQTTNINVFASVYNPANDLARTFVAIGPLVTTKTDFSGETAQFSGAGNFSNGEMLTGLVVQTAAVSNPNQFWAALGLFRKGRFVAWLAEGYCHSSHTVSWSIGHQGGIAQSAAPNPAVQGALWHFDGSQLNDGANSGNHTYELSMAAGGRLEIEHFMVVNLDTAARTTTINLLAATGGATLEFLYGSAGVALNAAAAAIVPSLGTAANAVGNLRAGDGRITLAPPETILATVAAVAVSQDTRCTIKARVWGGKPTVTMTGPTGSTPTTTTDAFLTG